MTQVDPAGDRINVIQLMTDLQIFDVLAKGICLRKCALIPRPFRVIIPPRCTDTQETHLSKLCFLDSSEIWR